ncbi:hypothetical protein HY030_02350 [Candidatus Gottesmanbacteria bacterium]|nr:hypothetical protein [Candidatus Gottesmanbacteria bacterium]
MSRRKRSLYELKKLSDFWFDLAKIALASLIIKQFDPQITITIGSLVFALSGLIAFLICVRIGIDFARKVEDT